MKKLLFLFSLVLIASTCQKEEQSYPFGTIVVKHTEKEEIVPRENIAAIFSNVATGRNTEITKTIEEKILTYTEGVFNGEVDKFMDRAFKLFLKSNEQFLQYQQMFENQHKNLKYTLYESHVNYISRAVECDLLYAFAIENRTRFDVELVGANINGKKTIQSELYTRYGNKYVTYDEATNTFHVDGSHIIYGFTPKDTLDMYFTDEITMHSKGMREFVPLARLDDLRRYFKEAPLYR